MGRVVLCVQNLSVPKDPRVWREATALAASGHDVTVVCPREPGLSRHEVREGVEIRRYPAWPGLRGPHGYVVETLNGLAWTLIWCLQLRLRGPLDVLHTANPPDVYFLVALLLRPWGTRFVFDQHDLFPELATVKWGRRSLLDRVMRVLERASYRSAGLVIAANNSYRGVALGRGGVTADKVVVVRNGPDRAGRTAQAPSPPSPLRVAYAGVMGRQDGVETLLRAVALVANSRPDALNLDLIGSGDDVPRLKALAGKLGISPIVTWAGWLSGDAYLKRLHAAHVGVSADADNAFNRASTMIKVAEYVAGELPSIVADLPENRVTAGPAAIYFKAGDAADLARRIEELIDSPGCLQELSRQARIRAPGLLWGHSAERLTTAYSWLLERGPQAAGEQVILA